MVLSCGFHAAPLLSLCRSLYVPGLATTAYARHNFRHFGVGQQYRGCSPMTALLTQAGHGCRERMSFSLMRPKGHTRMPGWSV
jgi:hypothetical protein